MSEHYTVTVPVTGSDGKTRYPRVGAMFANHRKETGEVVYAIKLDFPVGATELVAFAPKSGAAQTEEDVTEEMIIAGQASAPVQHDQPMAEA